MIFHMVEDGMRPLDEADGSLVIDTSGGQKVVLFLIVSFVRFDCRRWQQFSKLFIELDIYKNLLHRQ